MPNKHADSTRMLGANVDNAIGDPVRRLVDAGGEDMKIRTVLEDALAIFMRLVSTDHELLGELADPAIARRHSRIDYARAAAAAAVMGGSPDGSAAAG